MQDFYAIRFRRAAKTWPFISKFSFSKVNKGKISLRFLEKYAGPC